MKKTTLGYYIRLLRRQHGMTQAQLAARVGVTDKAVSKWERDRSYPDLALFPKLADLLGVTVNDLLRECTDEKQPSRLLQIFGMSHDIRTPIHIILGSVNMAEHHRDDPELISHCMESIRISGEYLLQTVDRLMLVANQESGRASRKGDDAHFQDLGEALSNIGKKEQKKKHSVDFAGKRILVADDVMLNREIAGEILRQTGAEVEFAPDGKECLSMLEAAPAGYYDLILMDIMMPVMNGPEAARRIRQLQDPRKAGIPVIAVSASVYEKDRRAALDAGMDAFVEKPIFTDKLYETLNEYLGK